MRYSPTTLDAVRPFIGDAHILYLLNQQEKRHEFLADARARRLSYLDWVQQIKDDAEDGQIALIIWQRDCDMCEGTSRYILPADTKVINERVQYALANAEGPVRYWVDKPSAHYEPEFRDRALEAHEDGHPHIIY